MNIKIKQISSLEKFTSRNFQLFEALPEKIELTALKGERVSYQIAFYGEDIRLHTKIWAETDMGVEIKLFHVDNVAVDNPTESFVTDEDYILNDPGLLPDLLTPMDAQNERTHTYKNIELLWVRADIPADMEAGKYNITVHFGVENHGAMTGEFLIKASKTMTLTVLPATLPKPRVVYTRWIYLDCIATAHNVEIFSEAHWSLIEKYIAAAADVGINMLLVPVHTPPLDTEVGTARPCVQLVDIEKKGDKYIFSTEKLSRYIGLCRKYGIKYYEIAHMFSQWGAEHAPNIRVTEKGIAEYKFGWHTDAAAEEYIDFLKQYIPTIREVLEREGVIENTYFHISDEPKAKQLEKYRRALNIFKPLVGKAKIFDALSSIEFYDEGLVSCPVTAVKAIHAFLEREIEDQWVYYCCHPERVFPNSFIAMPSPRIRVLGFLIYKYNIKGFLHWGLNYYNTPRSKAVINPYVTTSSSGGFSSGDGYILYPAGKEVYGSSRGQVLYQAMEDIAVCQTLEAKIGREAVVEMIDKAAERDLRFDSYPHEREFTEQLREQLKQKIISK